MKRFLLTCLLLAGCSKHAERKEPPVNVTVTAPIKKDVPIYLENPGHIEPFEKVAIVPQVSGKITRILYEEGDFVEKGNLIIEIDKRPYVAVLMEKEAELAKNQAELKYAIDTLERNTPLVKEEYVSKNYYENLETNVATIEAMIAQNLADIEAAKINVDYCEIHAPISGILGVKKIDVGNVVSQEAQSELVTINRMRPVYCEYFVKEKDLPKVFDARDRAQNPLDLLIAYNDDFSKPFCAQFQFINNEVDQSTGMIQMRGTYENSELRLWPGQFVNTRLILYTQKNAILVKTDAIQINTKGHYVYLVNRRNEAEMHQVTIGQQEGDYYIIEKGISLDDSVVLTGQLKLYPGAKVAVKGSDR
ncbi:MAG: efflux RND transporter periplasmic adaptor subunit [Simkaniaceae bacterium]|nr:efflux RND transporter periplasmic adaptor subunit [Simkaniaceae bacterium]